MWDLLTPAELEWKATCRRFAEEEIAPRFRRYDERNELPREIHDAGYARGMMNLAFPEALGGRGLSQKALVVGGEELAAVCAPSAFTMGFNHGALRPVLEGGTDDQKARLIRDLIARRGYASIALTEEGASGSSLLRIATRAERVPGGYAITGEKCMVGNGCAADLFIVLAETFEGDRARGLSFFAVPRGPGVEVGPNPEKIGFRCLTTPTVRFAGAIAAEADVIGGVGGAEALLQRTLDYIRFGGACVILGIAVGAVREAIPWLEAREVGLGEPLIAKSHIQLELGEIYAEIQAVRMMLWRAADLLDAGRPCSTETSIAKLRASRLAVDATNRICQMFGWRGIDRRYGIEKRLRDARVTTIYEGTSEVQLLNAFRALRRSAHEDGGRF